MPAAKPVVPLTACARVVHADLRRRIRDHVPLENMRAIRLESKPPARALGVQVVRLHVERHDGADETPVPAAIGEADRPLADLRFEERAPLAALPAADLEDVGEVVAHRKCRPKVDGRREKVRERRPLGELIVEQDLAPNVNRVRDAPRVAAERLVVDRQVDLRRVGTDHLRRQFRGSAAGHVEHVVAQHARVVIEQSQAAMSGRIDVALFVEQQEKLLVFEHHAVVERRPVPAVDGRVTHGVLHGDRSELRLGVNRHDDSEGDVI